MVSIARRSRRSELNIWPAFVDALGQLVIAIIFLLLIFTVAQFLTTDALSGRDQALQRLTQQINELTDLLSLEKRANSDLRLNLAQLSTELQSANAAKDALTTRLAELAAKSQDDAARADRLSRELLDANQSVSADKEKVDLQLKELESLRRDIEALRKVRTDLEAQVSGLAAAQQKSQQDLTAARDRTKELEAQLSTAAERTALAQKEIDKRDIRISELEQQGKAAQDQVGLLNQQIAALREQLQKISAALDLSEAKSKDQQAQIVDLGRRLNLALASKVEELARFRSEFFGRLRQVLGDRPDIRIVGDRFVFQSEVLFGPANADLGDDAKRQLAPVAAAIKELIPKIPNDLNWVLRVDGHTDKRPIATAQFPSNWELSTERAISVVRFLIDNGVPADRLAAAGFGEFQPIDAREDEVAFRRNRRIEL
ncbi:MAG: peptidoglycan -binding protein, partial [Alphaproteobacteria bacterium]|nr:peptidoglycan -binding protein [Alphaproteobacteria bacterium]